MSRSHRPRPTIAAHDGRRIPAYLNVAELASLTGVSDRGIRKACAERRIESWTVDHGQVVDHVIPILVADAWARSRGRRLSVDDVLAVVSSG
jgi:hypothetical protein